MTDRDDQDAKSEAAVETLAKHLKEFNKGAASDCASLNFAVIIDECAHTYTALAISTKRSKSDAAKRVCLTLYLKEGSSGDGMCMLELQDSSKQLLQDRLIPCLKCHANKIRTLQFTFIDEDRLPGFINMVSACFVKKNQPLKKIIFESCGFNRPSAADASIFDVTILRQLCLLSEEFHLDYEEFLGNPPDQSLLLSVLSHVGSLKTISLSYTLCDDMTLIANILTSNRSSLQEIVLYNAFSGITRSALQPLVDAMTQHATLKKFTLLHSKMFSRIYRWAIMTILEGNKNITGLCTDGNYSENATWLGRCLGSNEQLTEVNFSHPNFEDDYSRVGTTGATLSLILGINRNTVLRSVKLIGLPLGSLNVQAVRTLFETNETIEKFACGTNYLKSDDFSFILGGMLANTTIKKLSIQSVDLDPIAAQTVADVLSTNATLQSLSLGAHRRQYNLRARRNAPAVVDPSALVAALVADGLRRNTTLRHLSLPKKLNNSECIKCFSCVLENENKVLERLTFWPKDPCLIQDVDYWTLLNRCKRDSILSQTEEKGGIPIALWAHVLASRANANAVRYFISQMPPLFGTYAASRQSQSEHHLLKTARKRKHQKNE